MATQTLEFNATSGLTISCKLFALESDTIVDTQTATEKTNDKGRYSVAFTDVAAGAYRMNGFVSAVGGFANEIYDLTLITDVFLPRSEVDTAAVAAVANAVWDELQADHIAAGSFGVIATEIADILVDTAEIGAAGAGLTAINLPDQTMNITGNITGNVTGSVGSVTAAVTVGTINANVITAVSIAADAITDAKVAADVTIASVTGSVGSVTGSVGSVTGLTNDTIADQVWDEVLALHLTAGTTGNAIFTTALNVSGIKSTTDQFVFTVPNQVDANALSGGGGGGASAAAIADAVWDEVLSGHLTAGTTGKALSDIEGDVTAIKANTDLITSQTANQINTSVNTLTIMRGDSFVGTHAVTTDYTGYTATFTIRHRVTDAVLVTATAAVTNSTTLTVTLTTTNTAFALLTEATEFGPHPYDIQLVNGATQATVSGVAIITRDQTRT